ncbi:MAG TPA: glycosyltransferase [Planctomycetota bacterium]|nr:glycosyltransferase [Planctomycetota bacterium]
MVSLSVVIPFFDEEENVVPLLEELEATLPSFAPDYEIVAVDDGSRDRTPARLLDEAARRPRLRVLRFAANAGQSAALAAGFRAARGDVAATLDGDRQMDPRDLRALLERLAVGDVDLVYGRRARRADGSVRRWSTRVANAVRDRLTGDRVADTGCPLKAFRRETLERLAPMLRWNGAHRFLVTLARMEGFRAAEIEVSHRPRVAGRSKYGVWNRAFRGLRDCLGVGWMRARRVDAEATEIAPARAETVDAAARSAAGARRAEAR